jgi:hypothetical protein
VTDYDNPTPAELAEADQKLALIRAAVDRLLTIPLPDGSDRSAAVADLCIRPVVAAALDVADRTNALNDLESVLVVFAAELLYRHLAKDGA